tara:strand:+ start:325 stop:489 length:165 start_codon:yes stop_codon:yes gene_type:complete
MRVVTKQCRTSGADLHVQYRSITAIEIIPEIAIDKPLQLKARNNFGEHYEAEKF